MIIVPGGWSWQEGSSIHVHQVLYLIRKGGSHCTFAICNMGDDGLQYHPVRLNPNAIEMQRKTKTVIPRNSPLTRVVLSDC